MHGVLVLGGGAGMPSEYCHGTIEQGTEAHELPTHPVTCLRPYPAKAGSSTLLVTPPLPKWDKAARKMQKDLLV